MHNVFHVSQLKKCLQVPDKTIEIEEVELEPNLTYVEYPVRILDQKDRVTRNRTIKFYKVHGTSIQKRKLHGNPRII